MRGIIEYSKNLTYIISAIYKWLQLTKNSLQKFKNKLIQAKSVWA